MNFSDKFYFADINGTGVFRSGNIKSRHAFSTRLGGVSTEAPYKSLNLSYGRGDPDCNVSKNLEIFAGIFDSDRAHMVTASQVHSACVRTVTACDAGKNFDACDGFATNEKGIILSSSVADCTPILLEDSENSVIASLHAGWRGTVGAIAQNGVLAMLALGANLKNIQVAIGPCIHSCCYEVKEDFYSSVISLCGEDFAKRHIKTDKDGIMRAYIVSMNCEILLLSGILPENISVSSKCTCCESELFFSHRAYKGIRGGMKAAIML